jgi:hypothetical protein
MNIFNWIVCQCTNKGKAWSHYRRGIMRAKAHDHQGAIDDYTVAITNRGAPWDVRAMARYNRALVHAVIGDMQHCHADLNAVLAMVEAPTSVKLMTRQKLARLESRALRSH